MSEPSKLDFNYTVIEVTQTHIIVELDFAEPAYVSSSNDFETLVVHLTDLRD